MPWQCHGQMPGWPISFQSVQRPTATVEDSQTVENSCPSEYDEVFITKNVETIEAFFSHVIPMKTERAYLRGRINVMTQALRVEDRSLSQGLTVQNMYTELRTSSKNAIIVVRNSTAYDQALKKKIPVAQGVAAALMSEPLAKTQLVEGGEEPHTSQSPRLTVRQRQGR